MNSTTSSGNYVPITVKSVVGFLPDMYIVLCIELYEFVLTVYICIEYKYNTHHKLHTCVCLSMYIY